MKSYTETYMWGYKVQSRFAPFVLANILKQANMATSLEIKSQLEDKLYHLLP